MFLLKYFLLPLLLFAQSTNAKCTNLETKEQVSWEAIFPGQTKKNRQSLFVFWANWCSFCNQLGSIYRAKEEDFRKMGVDVISVSFDDTLAIANDNPLKFGKVFKRFICDKNDLAKWQTTILPQQIVINNSKIDTVSIGIGRDKLNTVFSRLRWNSGFNPGDEL